MVSGGHRGETGVGPGDDPTIDVVDLGKAEVFHQESSTLAAVSGAAVEDVLAASVEGADLLLEPGCLDVDQLGTCLLYTSPSPRD